MNSLLKMQAIAKSMRRGSSSRQIPISGSLLLSRFYFILSFSVIAIFYFISRRLIVPSQCGGIISLFCFDDVSNTDDLKRSQPSQLMPDERLNRVVRQDAALLFWHDVQLNL